MSDLQGINALLDMTDIEVTHFIERDEKITLFGREKIIKCPVCGATTNVSKGSTYPRTLTDCPIMGKETVLVIRPHRVNCFNMSVEHDKRRNLVPVFEEIGKNGQMTKRLRLQIANSDFAHKTFKQIADTFKISDKEVARILVEKAKVLDTQTAYPECTVIGIDETHLGYTGKSKSPRMCSTIVNMSGEKTYLLDILPDSKQTTIEEALDRFINPESIKYVTIDMNKGYRNAILECLPTATVIIDRFHVEKHLNDAVGAAKKLATEQIKAELAQWPDGPEKDAELKRFRERRENHYWFRRKMAFWNNADLILAAAENGEVVPKKKLEYAEAIKKQFDQFMALCNDYPLYAEIVSVHEAFAEVYDAPTKELALEMFDKAVSMLPPMKEKNHVLAPFWGFVKTVNNWKPYIFNYFDATDVPHRTNGPVEQWNHEIKAAHNDGRGYNYEVLRWKILFGAEKVMLNEQYMLAPITPNPYDEFVVASEESGYESIKNVMDVCLPDRFHASKIFSRAAKEHKSYKTVYRYFRQFIKDPSNVNNRMLCIEHMGASLPFLNKAAVALAVEYEEQRKYIREGVSFEEIQEQANLIHQQLADGLESDDMLVPVEVEQPEEELDD